MEPNEKIRKVVPRLHHGSLLVKPLAVLLSAALSACVATPADEPLPEPATSEHENDVTAAATVGAQGENDESSRPDDREDMAANIRSPEDGPPTTQLVGMSCPNQSLQIICSPTLASAQAACWWLGWNHGAEVGCVQGIVLAHMPWCTPCLFF
jgi:hypothetical protein